MTPEEERLAGLLAALGERHVPVGTDGAWLGPRLRRARLRRSVLAATAAAVAVVAVAGGVAATGLDRKADPVPPAASPTPSPVPSPTAAAPVFVSAIGVRPDGTGAAVVGPCQVPSSCEQTLRRTANAGRTLDSAALGNLPAGPGAPRPARVSAAGRIGLYVWAPGSPTIAWSATNGYLWKQGSLDGDITDVDAAPDSDSVWIATQSCTATADSAGCPFGLLTGKIGDDPRSFASMRLPLSRSLGPVTMSRGTGGRAAVAVGHLATQDAAVSDAVFLTDDDGRTWTRQDLQCQQRPPDFWRPVDVSLAPDGSVWALCGESTSGGELRKRAYVSDGPGSPFRPAGTLPERGTTATVAAASRMAAWVSAGRGPVMGTSDGGRTWTSVTDDSAFTGPVQVLPDGTALAPGQDGGHGAIWTGTGTSRWSAHAVSGHNLGPGFTDCDALRPGDDLDFGSLNCNPEKVQAATMDCSTGIYVRLLRPGRGDLEGITGVSPAWRAAPPPDPRYGRTPFAFNNCFEEEAGHLAFAIPTPSARGGSGLWPAKSHTPTAGACATPDGPVATVDANPDVPSPRCTIVRADQRLRVRNTTNRFGQPGDVITVQFAGYPTRTLAVGQETTFDRPMGEYLAPGVHDIHLSVPRGTGGAEIWLKAG